ncbi:MAG: double-strand break repair protein AddB [Proteobacteria bacterium]|nr:double-strand break repair protein AddB [Pseudomonadota bacterium]
MSDAARILTIAPGRPFLDTLAAGLLAEAGGEPERLAEYLILLPTRRACRALGEAFLRVGEGQPLILPAIQPLGDVDEEALAFHLPAGDAALTLPPAIPEMRRTLLLTRMIMGWKTETDISPDQAVRLAGELARLLDQVQTERLNFANLHDLAPAEYADHWRDVLKFLEIVTHNWPGMLAEQDCIDPANRRNRLLEARAQLWRENPPESPVIAAGSTGSIPATADLLEVVTGLPRGRIVLPGLDGAMDKATQREALDEPTHPQYGMLRLLQRLETPVDAVAAWEAGAAHSSPPARAALAAEALRPAETTDAWRALEPIPDAALEGVQRVDCTNEAEEAGVIALMLRHALEEDGKTAALVTPDRQLARRVTAELRRWKIEIDDSAGRPLADTPPAVFLRLVARAAGDGLAPVILLSALKHPIAAGGMARGQFVGLVRQFEKEILRGPRPAPGIEGLRELLAANPKKAPPFAPLLDVVEHCLGPLAAMLEGGVQDFTALIDAHMAAAEALAGAVDETGSARLWANEDGEALANAISELRQAAPEMGEVEGIDYAALFETLISGGTLRPRYGLHPRLHIWGPLEARLLHADLTILGGLNEGVWPPDPGNDPWMSRPMRKEFGLPSPERRIGLAAHDFAQAFAAPRVALTRAAKSEGAPTIPSRWLTRLDTVLEGAGIEGALTPEKDWRALYHALSRPSESVRIGPPAPCPPLAARPRELSVTRIQLWMREPYAIYADKILRLRPLDALEADPGAADRGSFIHDALDKFVRDNPGKLPADALDRLLECGREAFGEALGRPAVMAFWWPRFQRVAEWFLDRERERRAGVVGESHTEIKGRVTLKGKAGDFVLTAKADRIDSLKDGGHAIIDYKTGQPPSADEVTYGYAPQLPLEAVILAEGGFEGVKKGATSELAYWRLSGGEPAGEIRIVKGDPDELARAARKGLLHLINSFDDPKTPYMATPRPEWADPWNDYAHLARNAEWAAGGGGDK